MIKESVSPVLGDVLDVYWTMYGQTVTSFGLNSQSNRSEQSPAER